MYLNSYTDNVIKGFVPYFKSPIGSWPFWQDSRTIKDITLKASFLSENTISMYNLERCHIVNEMLSCCYVDYNTYYFLSKFFKNTSRVYVSFLFMCTSINCCSPPQSAILIVSLKYTYIIAVEIDEWALIKSSQLFR